LVPPWLRPGVCAVAAGVLVGLLVWFGTELIGAARQLGLAERVLAGAEAVWPLMVVLACRWGKSRARMRRKSPASADIQGSAC
jgi:hypothetical protein